MKGYWIAHIEVSDPKSWAIYVDGAKSSFEKYNGKPIARGGKHIQLEGDTVDRPRHVVFEFPTYQAAVDCYNSPEYQTASEHRKGAGVVTIVIVEGT